MSPPSVKSLHKSPTGFLPASRATSVNDRCALEFEGPATRLYWKPERKVTKNKLVAKSDVSLLCHVRQWHLFASPFRQTRTEIIFFQRIWKNIRNTCACIRIYMTLEYTSTNTDPNSCSQAKTAQNSHFNTATHKFSANSAMAAQQDCRDCLAVRDCSPNEPSCVPAPRTGTVTIPQGCTVLLPGQECTGQALRTFGWDVHISCAEKAMTSHCYTSKLKDAAVCRLPSVRNKYVRMCPIGGLGWFNCRKDISPTYRCCLSSAAENHSRNFMFEHMDELVMPYLLRETNRARLDGLQGRTAFPLFFFFICNPIKGHNGGTEFLF